MYKNVRQISKSIKFPIYKIPSIDTYSQDGILFLDGRVLDDTNWPFETIGLRRRRCHKPHLYPLKKWYRDIYSMITSKHSKFIDSKGTVFYYCREKMQKIKCHKIKGFKLMDTYTLIYLEGIKEPLELQRPPADYKSKTWCKVLYYNGVPWKVLKYIEAPEGDSRMRV